jgi:hypothetical protein
MRADTDCLEGLSVKDAGRRLRRWLCEPSLTDKQTAIPALCCVV